jgi:hypothetical protein
MVLARVQGCFVLHLAKSMHASTHYLGHGRKEGGWACKYGARFHWGYQCTALRAAAACGSMYESIEVGAGGLKARTQARGRQGLLARQAAEATRVPCASRPSLLPHNGNTADSLGKHSSWTAPARLNGNDSSILQQLSQNLSAPAPESRAGVCRIAMVLTCLMCSLVCAQALVI